MTDEQTTTTDPVIRELREVIAKWEAEVAEWERRRNDPLAILDRAYQIVEQQHARRAQAETPPA